MHKQKAVQVKQLVKKYGNFTAVNNLSFDVDAGTVFAFLGTNGAGKTTTISCITSILSFDSGEIIINGNSLTGGKTDIRRDIGVVFQSSLLDPLLTVEENLKSRATFYGLEGAAAQKRIKELSELIGLSSFFKRRYGALSGGQKRRVDIARSLVHAPSILFLDEPTAGLDPQSRKQVWETIHTLRENHGMTVFLTTHYMEETEEADQVAIIDNGVLVAQGTPVALKSQHSYSILTVTPQSTTGFIKLCNAKKLRYTKNGEQIELEFESSKQALDLIQVNRDDIEDFDFRHGTMDDVFLSLTSRKEES